MLLAAASQANTHPLAECRNRAPHVHDYQDMMSGAPKLCNGFQSMPSRVTEPARAYQAHHKQVEPIHRNAQTCNRIIQPNHKLRSEDATTKTFRDDNPTNEQRARELQNRLWANTIETAKAVIAQNSTYTQLQEHVREKPQAKRKRNPNQDEKSMLLVEAYDHQARLDTTDESSNNERHGMP